MKTGKSGDRRDHDKVSVDHDLPVFSQFSRNAPTFRTPCRCFPGPGNIAKSDRTNSRRRQSICSGPDSAYYRIMTCQILGLGEKRYNLSRYGLGLPEFLRGFEVGNNRSHSHARGLQDPGDSIEGSVPTEAVSLPGRFRLAWPG